MATPAVCINISKYLVLFYYKQLVMDLQAARCYYSYYLHLQLDVITILDSRARIRSRLATVGLNFEKIAIVSKTELVG